MMYDSRMIHALYRKFLVLYPRGFREQFGESMQQTFQDLCNEKQQTKKALPGFILWTFIETAIGIFREHLLLIAEGGIMPTVLGNLSSSTAISFLFTLPFMIMEVVNRRNLNEEFPFMLFFVMWLNLFAISLILLPIVRGRRTGNHGMAVPFPAQRKTLLTNPKLAVIISVIVFLSPGILPLLDSVGLLSLDGLFNGPNPEVAYLPGMLLSLSLILFPVAAGIIAGEPIAHTLQTGGRLFAHPINLIIVVFIVSTFAIGLATLFIDQWQCFIGVPTCD